MRTTCNRCGASIGQSTAVGWITTGFPAALVSGLLGGLLLHYTAWFLLLLPPLLVGLTWLFWEGPRWWTRFRNRFRLCPQCGGNDWSRPEYGGFGL